MPHKSISLICPKCSGTLAFSGEATTGWACEDCGTLNPGTSQYVDLLNAADNKTSDHYTVQWGEKVGFLNFMQSQPSAKAVMPAHRLGWNSLFEEIRNDARQRELSVYDAACGFGGIANELIGTEPEPGLTYVGADIHGSLATIPERIAPFNRCGFLMRWDISERLPTSQKFDYVICRASLHHTPDPRRAFASLCDVLAPGGRIAISVYNQKAICREASDDALRQAIAPLSPPEALQSCRQMTVLGQALQQLTEKVRIEEDLPLLGIRAGEYSVQDLVYYHFIKCFYNPTFGEKYSTIVNYDWYHPPYAYRYQFDEVADWFKEEGLTISEAISIAVQHSVCGVKAA